MKLGKISILLMVGMLLVYSGCKKNIIGKNVNKNEENMHFACFGKVDPNDGNQVMILYNIAISLRIFASQRGFLIF